MGRMINGGCLKTIHIDLKPTMRRGGVGEWREGGGSKWKILVKEKLNLINIRLTFDYSVVLYVRNVKLLIL